LTCESVSSHRSGGDFFQQFFEGALGDDAIVLEEKERQEERAVFGDGVLGRVEEALEDGGAEQALLDEPDVGLVAAPLGLLDGGLEGAAADGAGFLQPPDQHLEGGRVHAQHLDEFVLVQVGDDAQLLGEDVGRAVGLRLAAWFGRGISVRRSSRKDETEASPRMTSRMDFCLVFS
jgi:hypothetical protein